MAATETRSPATRWARSPHVQYDNRHAPAIVARGMARFAALYSSRATSRTRAVRLDRAHYVKGALA